MIFTEGKHIEDFTIIGTNFTKADTQTRSRFALTKSSLEDVYKKAKEAGFNDFIVLSTCNRTEFYTCGSPTALKDLVLSQLLLNEADLDEYFYCHTGNEAIQHFFKVVSGLDSQIIGDYEIVCQVKAAVDESRKHNLVGTITDRIANFAFQAQKKVKAHTNLSSGKYSVSYAAAELMFHENENYKNILMVGTGDFGSTVARNLRHYFPKVNLTLTNRTAEKAESLAKELKAAAIPFASFQNNLDQFDAIITTAGTDNYLIQPEHIKEANDKIFLDLSVPQAVNPKLRLMPNVRLYGVDEVSAFHNEILKQRKLEIPRAEKIVDLFISRLMDWHQVYNYHDLLSSYKEKIQNLSDNACASVEDVVEFDRNKKIEKTFSGVIQQIKERGYAGCMMIDAISSLVPIEK